MNTPGFCFQCGGAMLPGHVCRVAVNALRDEAMGRVAEKAETVAPDFHELATTFVVAYLQRHGPTSAERLTLECKREGIRPHDDRAFGPVYFALVRRHVIQKVGMVRRERGHGTAGGNIWALT